MFSTENLPIQLIRELHNLNYDYALQSIAAIVCSMFRGSSYIYFLFYVYMTGMYHFPDKLSCGEHRCEEKCHRGNCPPCWHVSFDELRCHCGTEVIYPPVPCGTQPPVCNRPCIRPQTCGHQVSMNMIVEFIKLAINQKAAIILDQFVCYVSEYHVKNIADQQRL